MKRTLLGALHLIGAAIFVVFMIARAAQAEGNVPTMTATCPAQQIAPLASNGGAGTRDGSEIHVILPTGSFQPA